MAWVLIGGCLWLGSVSGGACRAALEEANKGLEEKVATVEGSLAENEADLETAHDEIAKLKREVRRRA